MSTGLRIVGLAIVVAAVTEPVVGAAQRSDANSTIEISLREGKIFDSSGKESAWSATTTFTLHGDERVGLVVRDPNPLLFSVSTTTAMAQTEESKAAAEFAKAVAAVLTVFKGMSASAAAARGGLRTEAPECVIEGINVGDVIALLNELDSYSSPSNITGLLELSQERSETSTLKQGVIRKVDDLSQRASDAYARLLAVGEMCLSDSPLSVGTRTVACSDPLFKKDARASGACIDSKPGPQKVRDFVMMTLALQKHAEAAIAFLRDFARDVAAIDTPITLEAMPYSLQRQTVTVSVKPAARYEKFFNDNVRQFQKKSLGDHAVVLEPYRPVRIRFAPAFIIGFITNPTFSTVRKGSDFIITRTENPSTAYNVAAMLQITPAKWAEPTFGGYFQIGVSPNTGGVGFYAGGGITIERAVGIGAGFMWRQVNQLASGLSEGQALAGPELLKTETRYRPSWNVHLTTQLP